MKATIQRATRKSAAEVRAALTAVHHRADITPEEEQAAAGRYWRMLGHDLPAEERRRRALRFTADAPVERHDGHAAHA